MAIVPPTICSENEKGYFKDNDVEKAKEYLEKGLKELGFNDASELPAITLSYNTDEAHQKLLKLFKICGRQNLGVEVTLRQLRMECLY